MRACGAERGAVARRRCPRPAPRSVRPRKARRRRGAPACARAPGPGARDPRARVRARRGRGAGDAPRATSPMMHHARAGQRAARGQRRRGVGGWGEGTSPRGCKQRTPAHAEFFSVDESATWIFAWALTVFNCYLCSSRSASRGFWGRGGPLGGLGPGMGHSPRAPAGRTRT